MLRWQNPLDNFFFIFIYTKFVLLVRIWLFDCYYHFLLFSENFTIALVDGIFSVVYVTVSLINSPNSSQYYGRY